MALRATEEWRGGFVVDKATGYPVIVHSQVGAAIQSGFLRDPDGRLVVVSVGS